LEFIVGCAPRQRVKPERPEEIKGQKPVPRGETAPVLLYHKVEKKKEKGEEEEQEGKLRKFIKKVIWRIWKSEEERREEKKEEKKTPEYTISYEEFEREIEEIKGRGLKTLTASEYVAMLKNGKVEKGSILLTFDDGYESVYTVVFPLLKKYGIKATVFIVPKYIGGKGHLTWKQVKEMADSGLVEIGSHSLTHAKLSQLSEEEVRKEVSESKRRIERAGAKVNVFAWPYGEKWDKERADEMLKEFGYTGAFTSFSTKSGPDPYNLNRSTIGGENRFDAVIKRTGLSGIIPKRK